MVISAVALLTALAAVLYCRQYLTINLDFKEQALSPVMRHLHNCGLLFLGLQVSLNPHYEYLLTFGSKFVVFSENHLLKPSV